MTNATNAPETTIARTHCTVEIRNGWHIVRHHGEVIGKRYDMAHAVALAMATAPAPVVQEDTVQEMRQARETHRTDLLSHPERRGTAWYDDRCNAVHGLTRAINRMEDARAMADDDTDADPSLDVSDTDTDHAGRTYFTRHDTPECESELTLDDDTDRDARELLTARRAIMAGKASAREWGAPLMHRTA